MASEKRVIGLDLIVNTKKLKSMNGDDEQKKREGFNKILNSIDRYIKFNSENYREIKQQDVFFQENLEKFLTSYINLHQLLSPNENDLVEKMSDNVSHLVEKDMTKFSAQAEKKFTFVNEVRKVKNKKTDYNVVKKN